MTDPSEQKRRTADSFDQSAAGYVESDVHRRGDDLVQLATWLEDGGFELVESFVIQKRIEYDSWVEQLGTPEENRTELEWLFRTASAGAEELFSIKVTEGSPQSFSNLKLVLLARIPA